MHYKLLIIGHARHGKDTVAEMLSKYGLTYKSSSEMAAEIFIYDKLKDKYRYRSFEECYEDRMNHRAEWYDLICEYNKTDKAALAKEILKLADCYVGMRSRYEIEECLKQGVFDLVIWVDRSEHLPLEPKSSFDIDKSCADIVIDNNYSLDKLQSTIDRLAPFLIKQRK